MSSTIDTNVLLYASDEASPLNEAAVRFLTDRAAGPDLLYVFWPTIMGYLRISTHPAVFEHPLSPSDARRNIEALISLPHVLTPGEADGFWEVWTKVTDGVTARGNLVPDAHLVALMRQHGISTIWTRDRDLRRFSGIRVADPFA